MPSFIEKYNSEKIKEVQGEYLTLLGLNPEDKSDLYCVFESRHSIKLTYSGLRLIKSSKTLEINKTVFDSYLKWNDLKNILLASERVAPYYVLKDGKTFYTCDKNLYFLCKFLNGKNLTKN